VYILQKKADLEEEKGIQRKRGTSRLMPRDTEIFGGRREGRIKSRGEESASEPGETKPAQGGINS